MSAPVVVRTPRVLLPKASVDAHRWAVIACDQFTSQPEYWAEVEKVVGDAPSTLRMVFPELKVTLDGDGRDYDAVAAARAEEMADAA